MRTKKTMILAAGAVVLLGTSFMRPAAAAVPFESPLQKTTLPAGELNMRATSTNHDMMSIGSVETGNTGNSRGKADRGKPPVLVAPTCETCIYHQRLSKWERFRLALRAILG
ncbi:MAG: hypothetical protein ABSF64_37770 [Bryobacteraceae bacterium]